jgi:hypothetical protein
MLLPQLRAQPAPPVHQVAALAARLQVPPGAVNNSSSKSRSRSKSRYWQLLWQWMRLQLQLAQVQLGPQHSQLLPQT